MHVMIDIETLGTSHDSVILQIGAVGFAMDGMDAGLYADVTVQDQIAMGRKVDPFTLGWWLDRTSAEARLSVFERRDIDLNSLRVCLEKLNAYIKAHLINDTHNNTKHDKLWANSPSFDLEIIRSAMKMCEIKPVWEYWHEADVRTLKVLDGVSQDKEIKKIPMMLDEGVAHCALDDAKNQALYVTSLLKKFGHVI